MTRADGTLRLTLATDEDAALVRGLLLSRLNLMKMDYRRCVEAGEKDGVAAAEAEIRRAEALLDQIGFTDAGPRRWKER